MIFKKIFIGISLILSLSAAAAFASELPFNDVTEQTPYYSAVDRLYNMGIISGYEDGTFKPNDKISVAEGITLAEKLFGDASALPPLWSGWFSDKCGWNNHIELSGYPFRGDYGGMMTYETASELLLKLNNLPPINSTMWDTDVKYGGFSDYTNTMYVRGYEKRTSYCGITRAEFCNMLVFMLNYDGEYVIPKSREPITEPKIYGGSITNSRETILNAQSEMICVPEFVRKEFAESGYRLILVSNDYWTELFDNKYSGIYNSHKKAIYIRMGYYSSIPHEFGHYIQSVLQNHNIAADERLKNQLAKLKFTGDDYFMTSDTEFFAEAFAEYCKNGNRLKESCEAVYTYIDNALNAFSNLYQ